MEESNSKIEDKMIMSLLLDELKITANKFCIDIGYKNNLSIYRVLNGSASIGRPMRAKILKKYPDVNEQFLKTGEKPIIKGKVDLPSFIDVAKAFTEVLENQQKILTYLEYLNKEVDFIKKKVK